MVISWPFIGRIQNTISSQTHTRRVYFTKIRHQEAHRVKGDIFMTETKDNIQGS